MYMVCTMYRLEPTTHLGTLNILTHPRRANIFEIVAESKKVTFEDLHQRTGLSYDGLAKHLKQLFDNYLIKQYVQKSNDDKYAFFTLTQKGEYFHDLLHNVLMELANIPEDDVSHLFVMDAGTFWKLAQAQKIPKITKIFRDSKIVFTNTDFSCILERNEENDDIVLEEFLYSDECVQVSTVYEDVVNSTMCEYHLRRSKKLSQPDAQVVATAVDLGASLISDNQKLLQTAKSLGILCTDLNSVLEMNEALPLNQQFYKLANKSYDSSSMGFLIGKTYPEIIKKKLQQFSKNVEDCTVVPDEIFRDGGQEYSKVITKEIIQKLNRMTDESYARKTSYESFKILGKIYERRFQRDVHKTMDGINPILEFLDSIFVTLSNMSGRMNPPVKDSFSLAFAESNHLGVLDKSDSHSLESFLKQINDMQNSKISIPQHLVMDSEELLQKGWFSDFNPNLSRIYALGVSKRKLERLLDWNYCSLSNEIISLLNTQENKIPKITSLISSSYNTELYEPEGAGFAATINNHLTKSLNSKKWQSSQHLALLFQNDDKGNGLPYIETKTVPDANDLEAVMALLDNLVNDEISIKSASEIMTMSERMGKYYLDAAESLNILERVGKVYKITEFGKKIRKYSEEDKIRIAEEAMLNLPIFRSLVVYLHANNKTRVGISDITTFLNDNTTLSSKTSKRRASAVANWLCVTGIFKKRNNKLYLNEDINQKKLSDFIPKTLRSS